MLEWVNTTKNCEYSLWHDTPLTGAALFLIKKFCESCHHSFNFSHVMKISSVLKDLWKEINNCNEFEWAKFIIHSHSQGCHSEGNMYSVEMPLMSMTAIWYHESIAYDCIFRSLLISYFMFVLPRFVLSVFSTLSISELYFSHAFHTINSMVHSMNAHSVSEGLWPTSVSYQHNIHVRHNWKQIQFLNVMAGVCVCGKWFAKK